MSDTYPCEKCGKPRTNLAWPDCYACWLQSGPPESDHVREIEALKAERDDWRERAQKAEADKSTNDYVRGRWREAEDTIKAFEQIRKGESISTLTLEQALNEIAALILYICPEAGETLLYRARMLRANSKTADYLRTALQGANAETERAWRENKKQQKGLLRLRRGQDNAIKRALALKAEVARLEGLILADHDTSLDFASCCGREASHAEARAISARSLVGVADTAPSAKP